ncbi:hypothetical protein L3Q82_025406 [Scortum barcoo]|uniref:Uncharacterized protein n=1 Tax=Scortum barcoo TaxID=214431 RepID=A0ACB8WLK4_9TELE|nr:hypothetical protein L3Q82_025406 [Scortum barcoo]
MLVSPPLEPPPYSYSAQGERQRAGVGLAYSSPAQPPCVGVHPGEREGRFPPCAFGSGIRSLHAICVYGPNSSTEFPAFLEPLGGGLDSALLMWATTVIPGELVISSHIQPYDLDTQQFEAVDTRSLVPVMAATPLNLVVDTGSNNGCKPWQTVRRLRRGEAVLCQHCLQGGWGAVGLNIVRRWKEYLRISSIPPTHLPLRKWRLGTLRWTLVHHPSQSSH